MQDIHPPKGYKLILVDPSIALSLRRHRQQPACVWLTVDAAHRLGGALWADVDQLFRCDQDDVEVMDKRYVAECPL